MSRGTILRFSAIGWASRLVYAITYICCIPLELGGYNYWFSVVRLIFGSIL